MSLAAAKAKERLDDLKARTIRAMSDGMPIVQAFAAARASAIETILIMREYVNDLDLELK